MRATFAAAPTSSAGLLHLRGIRRHRCRYLSFPQHFECVHIKNGCSTSEIFSDTFLSTDSKRASTQNPQGRRQERQASIPRTFFGMVSGGFGPGQAYVYTYGPGITIRYGRSLLSNAQRQSTNLDSASTCITTLPHLACTEARRALLPQEYTRSNVVQSHISSDS